MIKISKNEALELNKRGVPWRENGICRTFSSNHKYYLSENPRNLEILKRIRDEKVVVS